MEHNNLLRFIDEINWCNKYFTGKKINDRGNIARKIVVITNNYPLRWPFVLNKYPENNVHQIYFPYFVSS